MCTMQIRQMREEELQALQQRLGQTRGMICALMGGSQTAQGCTAQPLPLLAMQGADDPGCKLAVQHSPHAGRQRWLALERQLQAYLGLLQQRSALLSQVSAGWAACRAAMLLSINQGILQHSQAAGAGHASVPG